jgi:G3E family GTPase
MNPAGSRNTKPMSDVLLITGFLGAGKTTLLKRILSWETDLSDTVVLVNEFGEVGVDGDLLKDAGSDVVELTSGCICCSLTVDLKQSLSRISEQYHPRRIIIEASGVADPGAIIPLLRDPSLCGVMKLADAYLQRNFTGRLGAWR